MQQQQVQNSKVTQEWQKKKLTNKQLSDDGTQSFFWFDFLASK